MPQFLTIEDDDIAQLPRFLRQREGHGFEVLADGEAARCDEAARRGGGGP